MKLKSILVLLALLLALCVLVSCNDSTPPAGETPGGEVTPGGGTTPDPLKEITGVTFTDKTVTYNGSKHTLLIAGTLPAGVTSNYSGNEGTDAGTYPATVTLSGEGYRTLVLSATLSVEKATLTGITFEDQTFTVDGTEKEIRITGTLPQGAQVQYENNKGAVQGTYNAVAMISGGKNYKDMTLTATMKLCPKLTDLAAEVIADVLVMPDLWSFFPDSLKADALGYQTAPTADYASGFVSTSAIPTRVIGKQMNVVYETIGTTETVLKALQTVYNASSAITSLYQNYINGNPEDYACFSGETAGIRFKITLDGDNYQLLADIGTANVELTYDSTTALCTGRVQLTDSNAVKYELGDNYLKISLSVLGVSINQMEFVRQGDTVLGYVYEFLGTESLNTKTSALIEIDDTYTTIISNKRESDDLIVAGEVEVYLNSNGQLLGTHVKESNSKNDYDTKWFHLGQVNGITSVKAENKQNILNAHTVYINGSANSISTKTVSLLNPTRRFDIEMKRMFVFVWDAQKEAYVKQAIDIPMLFIQSDHVDTFGEDFYDKNKNNGVTAEPSLALSATASAYITERYAALLPVYEQVKVAVTYADVVAYIGEKNAFFEENN